MFEFILGGAVLSLVSAPIFVHLWKVAADKKKKSLKEARSASKRRQYSRND